MLNLAVFQSDIRTINYENVVISMSFLHEKTNFNNYEIIFSPNFRVVNLFCSVWMDWNQCLIDVQTVISDHLVSTKITKELNLITNKFVIVNHLTAINYSFLFHFNHIYCSFQLVQYLKLQNCHHELADLLSCSSLAKTENSWSDFNAVFFSLNWWGRFKNDNKKTDTKTYNVYVHFVCIMDESAHI